MNRFVIIEGLPYLIDKDKLFAVRWDDKGFTVGTEVKKVNVPTVIYSELSVKAQCAGCLDSITPNKEEVKADKPKAGRKKATKAVDSE